MFSRFTSMIHHAVEALAPNVPLQQEFVSHWKSVTQHFVDVKDHKMSVDQTPVPSHLKQMLQMLVKEEETGEAGVAGPCMEFLLKERILETLYTLARTDCPPGMKQLVLQLFIKLLSHIRQPLLPHVHVHRPVQRLVKMCGEVKASPAETDEIQFLLTICSIIKQDPYLVSLFIEGPKSKAASEVAKSDSPSKDTIEIRRRHSRFIIVDSLLSLMHSEDARVSVKACEGLMLIASLPEHNAIRHFLYNTDFMNKLTLQLVSLYAALPKGIHPSHLESVDAKWGLDITSYTDDRHNFTGKRNVISFLSWLDFCDQLIRNAHRDVAKALAASIHNRFLSVVLEPAILQTSEVDSIMATAYLNRCLRLVSSPELTAEFVFFILGHEQEPEVEGVPSNHRIRQRLLERCDHISDEVCITTWKLFETLLGKPHEHVVNNLVLRNLVGRGYTTNVSLPASMVSSPVHESVSPSHRSLPSSPLATTGEIFSSQTSSPSPVSSAVASSNVVTVQPCVNPVSSAVAASNADVVQSSVELVQRKPSLEPKTETAGLSLPDGNLPKSGGDVTNSDTSEHATPVPRLTLSSNLSEVSLLSPNELDSSESVNFESLGVSFMEASDPVAQAKQLDRSVSVPGRRDGKGDGPLPQENADAGYGGRVEEGKSDTEQKPDGPLLDRFLSSSDEQTSSGYELIDIRQIVNAFLNFLPKGAISSHHSADSGYDSYLRDAKHQFSLTFSWYHKLNWPRQPVGDPTNGERPFYEGLFLRKLLDKLSSMLQQSYEVNLQVTWVASRLAFVPHPNINEYLLNPQLPLRRGCRTLPVVLQKLANDVQSRMRVVHDFQSQLLNVRHRLMGYSNSSIRRSDDMSLLAGIIVLEEFCKELAAIAFVKHHAETIHQ